MLNRWRVPGNEMIVNDNVVNFGVETSGAVDFYACVYGWARRQCVLHWRAPFNRCSVGGELWITKIASAEALRN